MTDFVVRRGWDRDRNARLRHRQQLRARAVTLLTDYLDAVAAALVTQGWHVVHRTLTSTSDLGAELTLRHDPADNAAQAVDPDALRGPARVRWDEDTGWCVSHHLLGAQSPALHRYLPTGLVPNPTEAARFIAGVLTPSWDPYDAGFAEVGLPYQTQFRYRGQSLLPVLDALEHALTDTSRPDPEPDLRP